MCEKGKGKENKAMEQTQCMEWLSDLKWVKYPTVMWQGKQTQEGVKPKVRGLRQWWGISFSLGQQNTPGNTFVTLARLTFAPCVSICSVSPLTLQQFKLRKETVTRERLPGLKRQGQAGRSQKRSGKELRKDEHLLGVRQTCRGRRGNIYEKIGYGSLRLKEQPCKDSKEHRGVTSPRMIGQCPTQFHTALVIMLGVFIHRWKD